MKHLILLFVFFWSVGTHAQKHKLPDSISSGSQGKMHVQGVAVDQDHGHVYYSFTNKLIKSDLAGNELGSVTGFLGHLGDLAYDQENGKLYASLEYKGDAIGAGISETLGVNAATSNGFYVVIFDVKKIERMDMSAEDESLLQTVYLREAVEDFESHVHLGDRTVAHRHGCSGIDGIAIGAPIGNPKSKKKYLYVGYGIYGDTTRTDNDNQVILEYDISKWSQYRERLAQGKLHTSGPKKPNAKYFINTGNTVYGIQNLDYDYRTGHLFAAVYRGKKSQFPNYDLFVIDGHKKSKKGYVLSNNKKLQVKMLSLLEQGSKHAPTGLRGWNFPWGSTGLTSLHNGLYYISHNGKRSDGQEYTTLHKYVWIGDEVEAFRRVN